MQAEELKGTIFIRLRRSVGQPLARFGNLLFDGCAAAFGCVQLQRAEGKRGGIEMTGFERRTTANLDFPIASFGLLPC